MPAECGFVERAHQKSVCGHTQVETRFLSDSVDFHHVSFLAELWKVEEFKGGIVHKHMQTLYALVQPATKKYAGAKVLLAEKGGTSAYAQLPSPCLGDTYCTVE